MLTILTEINLQKTIENVIGSVERLKELVEIKLIKSVTESLNKTLFVTNGSINSSFDWNDTEPPYLIPSIPFSNENLLALVFYKLGNHQRSFEFISEEDALYDHLLIATHMQFGYEISDSMLAFTNSSSKHNFCVLQQYGKLLKPLNVNLLKKAFKDAIADSSEDENRFFTIKHFVNFLIDYNYLSEAENILRISIPNAISHLSKNSLNAQLASVLMAQLKLPYDTSVLDEIQNLQQDCIAYYESYNLKVNAGLLLVDASEIANFKGDFISSKEYISKAILYFKEEDIPEFLGEAGLRKATLLYTWSKNGSPQYYKPAINAFQDVLKIFKRDTHPQKFAEIHHNLALIYSEIPVSEEEKPIWTAFSASSFKEVLAIYNKDRFPYEFAMASHNYATALMNFPKAKLHNNLDKAFSLFEDALSIRTVSKYPFERALTLLNQLELYWLMNNEDIEIEKKNFKEMVEKVSSISKLVNDKSILERANHHIEKLKELKIIIN